MVQEARTGISHGRVVFNDWLRLYRLTADQLRLGSHYWLALAMAVHVLGSWSDHHSMGIRDFVHDAARSHPGEEIQRS